jgi:hypothetical protein
MAIILFSLFNGFGVVFLLYVLVQFWKEAHRPMSHVRKTQLIELLTKRKPTVLVVTRLVSSEHQVESVPVSGGLIVEPVSISGGLQVEPAPLSRNAHGRHSAVSREARGAVIEDPTSCRDSSNGTGEVPTGRLSTRPADRINERNRGSLKFNAGHNF